MRSLLPLALLLPVACAPNAADNFVASNRSTVEMRAIQSRVLDGEARQVARGVVTTLHDLGYRITRVDPGSGTITATRQDRLRLSAVVRAQGVDRSVVRANATISTAGRIYEVDSAEFYIRAFFAPLSANLGREAFAVPSDQQVPEGVRPEPEPPSRPSATSTRSPSEASR